jgi:Homeodomain-containing transcription factor
LPQGAVLTKPTEPKPRLAKDEVELLESEFAKNPKPSSSVKRELAEQMGVEVPRINVGLRTGDSPLAFSPSCMRMFEY